MDWVRMRYESDTRYIINSANNIKEPQAADISDNHFAKLLISKGWPISSVQYPTEIIPGIWMSGIGFTDDIPSWCYYNNFSHIINTMGKNTRETYYKSSPHDFKINYLE